MWSDNAAFKIFSTQKKMKTRDWKTGIRVQKGVVRIVMHKIGCFTSKTYFYIFLVFLRTPGTQEILIIPENAKNLKEVSPSSMSFRGPPPFNLSSFGVKKNKNEKEEKTRRFFARFRCSMILRLSSNQFFKAATTVTDVYSDKDMADATNVVQSINNIFLLLLVHDKRRLNNLWFNLANCTFSISS